MPETIRSIHLLETDSTNDWLRRRITEMPKSLELPLLIVADKQSAGRGRGSHRWWSPPGALIFSLLVRWENLNLTRDESVTLSLRTARALAKTVDHLLLKYSIPFQSQVKPPNDLYLDGKKLAGILIESPTPEMVILGIGLNLNNPSRNAPSLLDGNANATPIVSLADLISTPISRKEFLLSFLPNLLDREIQFS